MLTLSNLLLGNSAGTNLEELEDHQLKDSLPTLAGHFALNTVGQDGSGILARDPLGVNKLFFALDRDGSIQISNYLIDLVNNGYGVRDCWSVPSGHSLEIDRCKELWKLEEYSQLAFNDSGELRAGDIDGHALRIRKRLTSTFRRLKSALAGKTIYVTLSGGLDSSAIAALAREWIGGFTAVCFCMDNGGGARSEDLRHAELVARELDVPLRVVTATDEEIRSLLDVALVYGQDWREFNVHCALVNAKIASSLREYHESTGAPAVVLTGDTMNELMADYSPVVFGGKEYYALPRLSRGRLRRFLVGGLDSGDREVGVFGHYGIETVQPYALCADAYVSLPERFLEDPEAKQMLVKLVMEEKLPSQIYDRPKVRAQVGGSVEIGGTLASIASRGIDGDWLKRRFSELFKCSLMDVEGLIRSGFYRFSSSYPRGDR